VGHAGPERRGLGELGIDVDRVEIAGDPGEQVDVGLGDRLREFGRVADAELGDGQ
jgi:hypothetical protein